MSILALVLSVSTAYAADFLAPKDENNPNVSTAPGETYSNLYAAGVNINLNSNVLGDLFAVGAMVSVNGDVEQDLSTAGGTIIVNGKVGGDLRMAGGNLSLNAPVVGDVLVAGGNINFGGKSSIGRDLIGGVGNLSLDIPVGGKAMLSGGTIYINSKIVGDLKITASESLTFGPKSDVAGKIIYKGPKEAVIEDGARVSTIEYSKWSPKSGGGNKVLFGFGSLISLIALFLAAWVLGWYKPNHVALVMDSSSKNPLANLGLGFVTLLTLPFTAILLFITMIGYHIALILMFLYLVLIFVGIALSALYLGAESLKWYKKQDHLEVGWKAALAGAVVFRIVSWVPLIGWIVGFLVFLVVFGSIIRLIKPAVKRKEDPKTVE
jgi:hypothetical protein